MFDFYAELAHQQENGTAAQLKRVLQNDGPPNAAHDEAIPGQGGHQEPQKATDPFQGHSPSKRERTAEQQFADLIDPILYPEDYRR